MLALDWPTTRLHQAPHHAPYSTRFFGSKLDAQGHAGASAAAAAATAAAPAGPNAVAPALWLNIGYWRKTLRRFLLVPDSRARRPLTCNSNCLPPLSVVAFF